MEDLIKRLGRRSNIWAHCWDCSERLDYQEGSIRWQCVEIDLCPKCAATRSVDKIMAKFKTALRAHKRG